MEFVQTFSGPLFQDVQQIFIIQLTESMFSSEGSIGKISVPKLTSTVVGQVLMFVIFELN